MNIHAPFVGASSGGSGGSTNPWNFIGNFDYADFATAGLTRDIVLAALPARSVLEAIQVLTVADFVGVGSTYYNIRAGILATPALYVDYYNAKVAATRKLTAVFDEDAAAGWSVYIGAASDVNLNTFTAGSVDVWLKYWTLPAGT